MRIREATAADARGIAHVNTAAWRATYRGIVPDDFLARMSVEAGERGWASRIADAAEGQNCVYVAEDDGRDGSSEGIVGFASGGPRREGNPAYAGELYTVYLLQGVQGHGIGRQLTCAVTAHLARGGMSSMLVWVLEANQSARRFYEALGGVLLPERHMFERTGIPLPEVSYGWADTGTLTRRG